MSEIKIKQLTAELNLAQTDMFLCVLLICVFNSIMSENKLTSVDFEIFGDVQGKSSATVCLFVLCEVISCMEELGLFLYVD